MMKALIISAFLLFYDINIIYMESIDDYMIKANFKKEGKTNLIIESPTNEKQVFEIDVKRDTYEIKNTSKS